MGENEMIARRAQEINPFIVMDVLERAHELESDGINIVHLEVGEPDFETPANVSEALCKAVSDGNTHYTHSLGVLELREAISEYYLDTYQVQVEPDQIVITSGTSPALLLLFSALLERGDQVILSDPHYACYPNIIRYIEGDPVNIPVYEEEGFQ